MSRLLRPYKRKDVKKLIGKKAGRKAIRHRKKLREMLMDLK